MFIDQRILEITNEQNCILLKKIMIKKNFARAKFFYSPPQSQNRSYGLVYPKITIVYFKGLDSRLFAIHLMSFSFSF